ncbi:MAG TPA: transglutaminase-like domain-containing protein [Ignavibacteria bacterium]
MREISPVVNVSVDEFLKLCSEEQRSIVEQIRGMKKEGKRIKPSAQLLDKSDILTPKFRVMLIDKVAEFVDENIFGRSEMCIQFAELLTMALRHFGIDARLAFGKAIYYDNTKEIFRWDHAWVRINDEVIDGNLDSLPENPMVSPDIKAVPYWGKINDLPRDWRLQENQNIKYTPDEDVVNIWWPELLIFLENFEES